MLKTNFNFDTSLDDSHLDDGSSLDGSRVGGSTIDGCWVDEDSSATKPAAEPSDLLSLCELSPGRDAVIAWLDDSGPVGRRLLDLGLLPGTPIRTLRRAPLGDPSVFELRGYRLCLRRGESSRVKLFDKDHSTPSESPSEP